MRLESVKVSRVLPREVLPHSGLWQRTSERLHFWNGFGSIRPRVGDRRTQCSKDAGHGCRCGILAGSHYISQGFHTAASSS